MRYKIIFLICFLAQIVTANSSTKFILKSGTRTSSPIPFMKTHPYSCELIAFEITDNKFFVNISNIDETVHRLRLLVEGKLNETYSLDHIQDVNEKQRRVCFQLDFNEEKYKDLHGKDVKLNFSLYNDTFVKKMEQMRQVYVIFTDSEQQYYAIPLPSWSIIITQLIGAIFIVTLPLNVQYRRFKPFSYNIMSASIYMFLLVVFLYISQVFRNQYFYLFQEVMLAFFSLICFFLYSQDLLSYLSDRHVLVTIIAVILSLVVILSDQMCPYFDGAYFLNDLIAFMVAGAFIKFMIIRKLKSSIWAIVAMWVFFFLRQFAVRIGFLTFDEGLSIRIVPLFLQIPIVGQSDPNSYVCSAFGSSKIIAMGVILNYSKRVDLYLSTHFYRIFSNILAILCLIAELVFNLIEKEIPTMQFLSILIFYPLAIGFMLFFANKRGEWAEIWHGSFYDIAVNRGSISRSVNFEEVEENFGRGLMVNTNSDVSEK